MRNLTEQELFEVESFKKQNGCPNVFVDTTYSKIKIFPIYNQNQHLFVKEIFDGNKYSRFDELIVNTLNTKCDSLNELLEIYQNEIDSLD